MFSFISFIGSDSIFIPRELHFANDISTTLFFQYLLFFSFVWTCSSFITSIFAFACSRRTIWRDRDSCGYHWKYDPQHIRMNGMDNEQVDSNEIRESVSLLQSKWKRIQGFASDFIHLVDGTADIDSLFKNEFMLCQYIHSPTNLIHVSSIITDFHSLCVLLV